MALAEIKQYFRQRTPELYGALSQTKQDLKEGYKTANLIMEGSGDQLHTVLPYITPGARRFYRYLKEGVPQGTDQLKGKQLPPTASISPLQTPVKFAGAVGARLLTDLGDDATRHLYWRHNHPMAIADRISDQVIGDRLHKAGYNPTQRAGITLAGIGIPTSASLGVWDITNPGEQFRPKGYAQNYADVGSQDRRRTGQPGLEFVERMVLGRRGRPLKYETAKQDLPNLSRGEYSDFVRDYWQNKGLTGLGLVKGTMRNIEGYPEARIIGFPVGLQAAGALAGGAVAIRQAATPSTGVIPKARTVMGRGAAGALAGGVAGKLTNMALAAAGRPKYPSTMEYQQRM